MKTSGHINGSARQTGPLIRRKSELLTFAEFHGNAALLSGLNKYLKLFRGEDGWFATGSGGQLWEYGKSKLGFTVTTTGMIKKARADGFQPTQLGDGEANFSCEWTNENILKLQGLLKLRKRSRGYATTP